MSNKKQRPKPVQPVTDQWIDYTDLHIDLNGLAEKLGKRPEDIEQAASRVRNIQHAGFSTGNVVLEKDEVEVRFIDWAATAAMGHYNVTKSHLEAVIAYLELIWRYDRASHILRNGFTYDHIREALEDDDERALSRAFRRKLTD